MYKIFKSLKPQLLILAALASLSFIGCNKPQEKQKVTSSQNQKIAEEFVFPTADIVTLDPALCQDASTYYILKNMYETLVDFDEKNQVKPKLAEKWEVSPDGKTYIFHLKKGVKFHNGQDLSAEDVKFSFERACSKTVGSPVAANFLGDIEGVKEITKGATTQISGIKVKDPQTIEIKILKPRSYFISKLSYVAASILPRNTVGIQPIKDTKQSFGTGPFQLAELIRNQEIILNQNNNYHGGKAMVKMLRIPIVKDSTTALNSYKAGKYHYYEISANDIEAVNNDPSLKSQLHSTEAAIVSYLEFNSKANKLFANLKLRQAIALAINRDQLVQDIFKGNTTIATGFVPRGMAGYNAKPNTLSFNSNIAKKLLAEAGYSDVSKLPSLDIEVPNKAVAGIRMAENIVLQLKKNLGIKATVKQLAWDVFLQRMTQKKIGISVGAWGAAYLDPSNFLSDLFSSRGGLDYSSYSNPKFDELCAKADMSPDHSERLSLYERAETILLNDAYVIPLTFRRNYYLKRPEVNNLKFNMIGILPLIGIGLK